MASAAHQQRYGIPLQRSASAMLLIQLNGAHDQLLHEIENLDRLTLGPLAAPSDLGAARWRISQASLRRRTLSLRILDYLADRVDGREAAILGKLRLENQLAMSKSARHVYLWTRETICEDWKGYCTASRDIRLQMKANILLEKQTLYPILERLAARGL